MSANERPPTAEIGSSGREHPMAIRSFAFEHLDAIAAVLDDRGRIVDTNEAWRLFASLNGASVHDTGAGVDYLEVCDTAAASGEEEAVQVAAGLRQVLDGSRRRFSIEYPCHSPAEDRWFLLQAAAAPVVSGAGAVVLHVDITARKVLEAELGRSSGIDELTGALSEQGLRSLIEDTVPLGTWSIVLIDVDRFSRVTTTLGRHGADRLLVQIATRLRRFVRQDDAVARLRGDQFVIACADSPDGGLGGLATRVWDTFREPFQVGQDAVRLHVSIGSASGSSLAAIVAEADERMQVDKQVRRVARRNEPVFNESTVVGGRLSPNSSLGMGVKELNERRLSGAVSRALLAHTHDAVLFFRGDGTIEWASGTASQLLGSAPSELIDTNGFELIHRDDRQRAMNNFLAMPDLGDAVRSEFRVVTPAGDTRWVEEIATNLLEDPEVGVIVAALRDISDRRSVEEEVRFQARLLDAVGEAVVAVDEFDVVAYWNPAAEAIYGWTAAEAIGRPISDVLKPADGWAERATEIVSGLHDGEGWSGIFWLEAKGGRTLPVMVTDTAVYDEAGRRIGSIGVSSDVTERLRDAEAQARLSSIVNTATDAIISLDLDGTVASWNLGAEHLFGVSADSVVGHNLHHLVGVELEPALHDVLDAVAAGRAVRDLESTWPRQPDGQVDVAITVSPLLNSVGQTVGASLVAHDISNRVSIRRQLELEHQQLVEAQQSARMGTFEIDPSTGTVRRSSGVLRILGVSDADLAPRGFDHIHPDDRHLVRSALTSAIRDGEETECTYRIVRRDDGAVRWVHSRTRMSESPDDGVIVGALMDVTESHEAQLALAHAASHDDLTGLLNRAGIAARLDELIRNDPDIPIALAFVDLDHFKLINDALSHSVGDAALRGVAERLVAELPSSDLVGRFGGDEFIVLRVGVDAWNEAERFGSEILATLDRPIPAGVHEFPLGASCGIALSRTSGGVDGVVRDADAALHQAKGAGRSKVCVFDESSRARATRRLNIETALHHALDRQQLSVVFQPVVDLTTAVPVGCEALLRWTHPELGVISPDEFIPVAEANGLIDGIGTWVLEQALDFLAEVRGSAHDSDFWVSVNVSARQLGRPDFVELLDATLDRSSIPAGALHLELTERVLVDDIAHATTTIARLRDLGVHISVDDFGTGYSSLSYLDRLGVDLLKIDRSFVQHLGTASGDDPIVRAIVALARALGLGIIAEGVETESQRNALLQLDVELGQGFLWARGLPADEFIATFAEH